MFSDQTGRFPVTSYRDNRYIVVLFEIASNNRESNQQCIF